MEEEKNKGGRPKAEIDQEEFESLCKLQCTKEEICSWFNITDKTLDRWIKEVYNNSFSDVFKQKRGTGRVSLRRAQMQAALAGNTSMLIFLGKNYLGQTDKQEVTHENEGGININVVAATTTEGGEE